ncbi:MAG: ferredoxin [Gallionellales bacterium 35-53-114]|jgi:CDP-4-dehydro-6-deoxyglucose reductase|nr:MAG: ferredoxin [Gallionellales bacterium 35-53-114]OYZ65262.1 MAG: ferredoxin [Gallionellales bacterium 24-53-125]OZB08168.1 MAG: ferredoxin [Gallionellales bacterium 39-52-133]HQS58095.1 2Fe-2S iron-sulfur cluster-binding protein [Gallionellaceae bacterium]HQS73650.1 2Fe-2S iron-sulfur cluster-binding protein [Gallionellaceae bacterium]
MSQLLSLSRAARLVGVNRSELQKRVKQGELDAFDGMVTIDNLLASYPGVQLEDNTEYSRVLFIKERAFGKRVYERAMPDVETLATRVNELSRELTLSQTQARQFKILLDRLHAKFIDIESQCGTEAKDTMNSLKNWLTAEVKAAMEPDYPNPLAVRDNVLRVMAAHVTVLPSNHDFFIDGPDTILEAALRAGIPLNYGCSGGNCGLCKARVVTGQVKKTRFHDYVRTEADKRDGLFLMCSNTAVTDLVIEAAVAGGVQDIPFQQIPATVKLITNLTPEMALLHLQTPRTNRLRFLAGQSVTLTLGKSLKAVLAVASCPCDDRNILFHVHRMPGNLFSDYVFNRLKNHEVVEIEGPQGEFILHEKTSRPLYFIAFDMGFAPVKSLIEHAMSLEAAEAIHLYWIGSNDGSIYLPNVGRAWADALDNFHYTQMVADFDLSNPAGKRGESLKVLLQGMLKTHPEMTGGDIYIAGPQAPSRIAEQFFLDLGLSKTRVFSSD